MNFKGHSPLFYLYKFSRVNKIEIAEKVDQLFKILHDNGASHRCESLGSNNWGKNVDLEKMWEKREKKYLEWIKEMLKKVPLIPKKTFFQWEYSNVAPGFLKWKKMLKDFENKQDRLKSLHRKILYMNCNQRIDSASTYREHLRYQEFEYQRILEFSKQETVKRFVEFDFAETFYDLKEALSTNTYWMIYIAGHASTDGFYVLDAKKEANHFVPYATLLDLLESNNLHVKCVFLNSCSSGEVNSLRAFTRCKNVDYLIAPHAVITDSVGVNGMFEFMKSLFVDGKSIPGAYFSLINSFDLSFTMLRMNEKLYLNNGHNQEPLDPKPQHKKDQHFDNFLYKKKYF